MPRGSREHRRLGDEGRETTATTTTTTLLKEAAKKNKPLALPFCLTLVLMPDVTSSARENLCQLNERRFGLMQVT